MTAQHESLERDPFSQLAACEQALKKRLAYEVMIAEISARVNKVDDLNRFLDDCAALMGKTVEAGGVFVFRYDGAARTMTNVAEWVAETVTPIKDMLQAVSIDTFPWWMEMMSNNKIVLYDDIREIPGASERELLLGFGIRSLLAIPIRVNQVYYGFVGFEDYAAQRHWSKEDVDILEAASRMISMVLEARAWEAAVKARQRFLENILDAIPERICVIDREQTMLLGNKAFRELYGPGLRTGEKCHKIFHGHDEACEICTLFESLETLTARTSVCRAPNGSGGGTRWDEVLTTPYYNEEGTPAGVVKRVMDITGQKEAEEALRETLRDLEQKVEARTHELKEANETLEKTNQELNEVNKALSLLARKVGRTREESQRNLALAISSRVMPMLSRLEQTKDLNTRRVDLQYVATELRQVTSVFDGGMKPLMILSPTEMQVALMIKNGLNSRQIAAQMNVSLHTVKSHRRNIRSKMGLKGEKMGLREYLCSTLL
jgi:PAS domain S-box-containing protein